MDKKDILKHLIRNTKRDMMLSSNHKDQIPAQYQNIIFKNELPKHNLAVLKTLEKIQSNLTTDDYQVNALKEIIMYIENDGYDITDFSVLYFFDSEEGFFMFTSNDNKKTFNIIYKGKNNVNLIHLDEDYNIIKCKSIAEAIRRNQNRKPTS